MARPTPVRGSTAIINEQCATIKEQYRLITELRNDNAKLVNIMARALDDMKHHACVTDETLRIMKQVHSEEVER